MQAQLQQPRQPACMELSGSAGHKPSGVMQPWSKPAWQSQINSEAWHRRLPCRHCSCPACLHAYAVSLCRASSFAMRTMVVFSTCRIQGLHGAM